MTKYVLEYFERGERDPTYRSIGNLTQGHHPKNIDDPDCFDGAIQRAFSNGEITKVRIRYESNQSLAAEAKYDRGIPRIKWFRRK